MFDVGFSEIFLIAIVAIIAIGPEDLPDALFRLGRFMRQVKMFLNNLRNQYGEIMHEAEVAHYRKMLGEDVMSEAAADKAQTIDHIPNDIHAPDPHHPADAS